MRRDGFSYDTGRDILYGEERWRKKLIVQQKEEESVDSEHSLMRWETS